MSLSQVGLQRTILTVLLEFVEVAKSYSQGEEGGRVLQRTSCSDTHTHTHSHTHTHTHTHTHPPIVPSPLLPYKDSLLALLLSLLGDSHAQLRVAVIATITGLVGVAGLLESREVGLVAEHLLRMATGDMDSTVRCGGEGGGGDSTVRCGGGGGGTPLSGVGGGTPLSGVWGGGGGDSTVRCVWEGGTPLSGVGGGGEGLHCQVWGGGGTPLSGVGGGGGDSAVRCVCGGGGTPLSGRLHCRVCVCGGGGGGEGGGSHYMRLLNCMATPSPGGRALRPSVAWQDCTPPW